MKKIIFFLLFLPFVVYAQPNGKILSNRSSNATLPVDSINANSAINLNQTTASVTLTFPNRTTLLTSGGSISLSNIGSVSVIISVSGSSNFNLVANGLAILKWVGTKWSVLYVGSGGGGGAFLPLAGGTADDSLSIKSISTVDRNLFSTTGSINLSYGNSGALRLYNSAGTQYTILSNSPTATRTVTIKDASGTLAFTSDIPTLTASNGLTRSTNDFQLGGTLGSNTTINGSGSRSLTLGAVGSKLTSLLSYTSTGVSMIAANAGSLTLNSTTSDISHAGTGNTSVGGIDARAYVTWNDGTNYSTVSAELNGVGFNTTNGSYTGFFKTSRLLTADRNLELPDSNGTIALTSNLSAYLPLTLSSNTTIAMGSRTLDFTKSGNIVFRPSNGTFYDATPVQSADMFNRFLYDNIGGPVFTWANASTAGIGITRVGNNTYVAYLKNSNLTADKTYQFPNANTTFVGDDATQTLTNKTISGASNTLTNIGNSSLSNSTISGISLGSNLSALTLGTYLTGTSYNGSAGVTVNVSTMTSTIGGAVPTPPNNTTTFLRGDGTFATPSSSGTVSTVSVTSTNGFAGTVANATTTPAITVSTTVTGLLKGNGTSMSAATAGTDYAVPATIAADATDADYTAVINSVKYLPSATLTANRSITIPTGSNGDFLEIYNNEAGFSWLLSGASVYLSDGTTIVTSLYANTNHLIRKVSGKWRILN